MIHVAIMRLYMVMTHDAPYYRTMKEVVTCWHALRSSYVIYAGNDSLVKHSHKDTDEYIQVRNHINVTTVINGSA
jgi:hypothetical protein